MRIWVGNEMEGKNIGKKTMFVESQSLLFWNIVKVIEMMDSHQVEAIYLGAGRVDVEEVNYTNLTTLFNYCKTHDILITIECVDINKVWAEDITMLNLLAMFSVQLVIRQQLEDTIPVEVLANMTMKVDDRRYAYFSPFKCDSITSLETLEGSLYENVDTLIYESEEM